MVGTCYAGPIEDGEQVLRPLRAFRTPLLDAIGPTRYVGFQSALDSTVAHGWRYTKVDAPPRAPRRPYRRDCRARVLLLVAAGWTSRCSI